MQKRGCLIMIKQFILSFIFIIFLVTGLFGQNNHYIRANASGLNTGLDWTNAWINIPTTFIRGDTYYIASGTYGNCTLNTAESGESYITIKKATVEDHGTGIGWDNSYASGQAIFSECIKFLSGYWIWDGIVGQGSNDESYGFKVSSGTDPNTTHYLVGMPPMGSGSKYVHHIQFKHTALVSLGKIIPDPATQVCVYSNIKHSNSTHNIIFSNNLLSNGSSNMLFRHWRDCEINNNYFISNWSSPNNHGQQISPGNNCDDILLSNNIFKDSFVFVVGCHKDDNDRWKIFNNIVIGGKCTAIFSNAESAIPDVVKSWEVYNNTIINTDAGARSLFFVGTISNVSTDKSYVYNNLLYNVEQSDFPSPQNTNGAIVHDYNAYFECSNINSEPNGYYGNGNPFYTNNILFPEGRCFLKEEFMPGLILSAPFNVDRNGTVRGSKWNNYWERGAFEYDPVPLSLELGK